MEKLQYDSFYKFLVSLGMVLITIPIILVYYLTIKIDAILVSENEFLKLTEKSLEILQKREDIITLFLDWLPFIVILSLALGLFFLIYGGFKWKILQKEIDEQTRLKTILERTNVEQMKPSEILEKTINEVEEEAKEIINKKEKFLNTLKVEEFCFHYISNRLSKEYKVQQNVRIAKNEFDMVAFSKHHKKDILYEVKYWPETPTRKTFTESYKNFKLRCNEYEFETQRSYKSKFIIVIPNEKFSEIKEKLDNYIKSIDIDKNIKIEYMAQFELEIKL